MNWGEYKNWNFDVYALSNSNVNGTRVADVKFCDHYNCGNQWYKASDVPTNQTVQIVRGYQVFGFLHALAVDEKTGLVALEVPNNDPRKFFNIVKSDNGFQLKSSYNNKYVVNEGNYFYSHGDNEGYEFKNY